MSSYPSEKGRIKTLKFTTILTITNFIRPVAETCQNLLELYKNYSHWMLKFSPLQYSLSAIFYCTKNTLYNIDFFSKGSLDDFDVYLFVEYGHFQQNPQFSFQKYICSFFEEIRSWVTYHEDSVCKGASEQPSVNVTPNATEPLVKRR
jgi:hypothetical protein